MALLTGDSFRFFFCSFGVLAGLLGLVAGGSGVGLLEAGSPCAWDWAGPLRLIFLFLLPVLGGWSPPAAAGLAASSCVAPSDLRFLRFLVSGKNPFFFRFMLMGLCVALGTSLASFFSDLGRLGGSEQRKEVCGEGRVDLRVRGPQAAQSSHTAVHTSGRVRREGLPSPSQGGGPLSPNVLDSEELHGLPIEIIEAAGAGRVRPLL